MNIEFVVAIVQNRYFGKIFSAYKVESGDDIAFFKIKESVVKDNIEKFPNNYSPVEKQIISLIDSYNENQIKKKFAGSKKCSAQDYLNSLDKDYIPQYIRPYIEAQHLKIVELLRQNNIRLFYKNDKFNVIYPEEEIIISSKKAKAVYNFIRQEDQTKYFLSVNYKNKEVQLLDKRVEIISNNPCAVAIDNRLYFFDDIDAKKLLPFSSKEYISVAKRIENQYFSTFIKNAIASDCLFKISGFKINYLAPTAQALIIIEEEFGGNTVFNLKFRYNDIIFRKDSKNKIVVTLKEENDSYIYNRLERNFAFEQEISDFCDSLFTCKIADGIYSIANYQEIKSKELLKAQCVQFLNMHKTILMENGISIEQGVGQKTFYTGKIDLNLRVEQHNDWFDVYAIVELDDFTIPFIALKPYILNDIHEFELQDGSIVVLPNQWFERYRDLLQMGKINKKTNIIEVQKFQLAILKNLPLDNIQKNNIDKLEDILSKPENIEVCLPNNVNATLRPYQITAYNWLKLLRDNNFGACLADDMGLGKTLCTLSILSQSIAYSGKQFGEGLFSYPEKYPHLLIVPKSLIYNWRSEINKFTPELKVLEYTGSMREDNLKSFALYDIIITGYTIVRNDIDKLREKQFNYIVLDESQIVKNSQSKTYQNILELKSIHRLALSGTPIENSLLDLWAQMNFINPGYFGSLELFKRRYVNRVEKNPDVAQKLKDLIKPFVLRRTKAQVLKDLPELVEQVIFSEMTDSQKDIYEKEKSKTRNQILEIMDKRILETSSVSVLQSLTKLRQIACHPQLADIDFKEESGKTNDIINKLESILINGHKVLIFSSFVKHLEIIANILKQKDIDYAMLTGQTQKREQEVKKFANPDVNVFLISIKAGGTGLNLTQADYVFIIDPWWNPQVELQAISRAHRMGQNSNVMVYRFISKDSIEEKIRKYQQKKSELAQEFVTETNFFVELKENVLDII